jgi:hypothetical protein
MKSIKDSPREELKRRRFLAGTVFTALIPVAGCLSAIDDDETEPEDNVETAGSSESSTDEEETESNEPEDREIRQKILNLYDEGVSESNNGISNRERGVRAWNGENYSTAKSRFSSAEHSFSDAKDEFSDAIDLTYEIGNSEAREICEAGSEYATVLRDAMRVSKRMADAGADGDADRANNHLDSARELEREADRLNVRDPSVLKNVLDL